MSEIKQYNLRSKRSVLAAKCWGKVSIGNWNQMFTLTLRVSGRTDLSLPADGTQVTSRRLVVPGETTMLSTLSLCQRPILTTVAGKSLGWPGQKGGTINSSPKSLPHVSLPSKIWKWGDCVSVPQS
jgi:hypothetical protein